MRNKNRDNDEFDFNIDDLGARTKEGSLDTATETPSMYLKLGDIFASEVEGLEEYLPIFDFQEGLKSVNNESLPSSPHAHGTATFYQSCFFCLIPFGEYYPVIRIAVASRKIYEEGSLIEKSRIGEELITTTEYTMQSVRIESSFRRSALEKRIYLVLRPIIVAVSCSKVGSVAQSAEGQVVSTINMATQKIE